MAGTRSGTSTKETEDGSPPTFPPADEESRNTLAAIIGKALKLDWVIAFTH